MNRFLDKKGFTLVETLVAIAILTIGITASISAVYTSIRASNTSQDQIFAYYLAQEAVEYVRYVRDTNIVIGNTWMTNLNGCLLGSSPCEMYSPLRTATHPNAFFSCVAGACDVMESNGASKVFGTQGSNTGFDREIALKGLATDTEIPLIVTVTWSKYGKNYSYVLEEILFDWSGL